MWGRRLLVVRQEVRRKRADGRSGRMRSRGGRGRGRGRRMGVESRGGRTNREHRARCGNSCSCAVTIAVTAATLDVIQPAEPDIAVVHTIAEWVVRLAGTSRIAAAASAAAHAVARALPNAAGAAAHAWANCPRCRDPRGILGDKPYTSNTWSGVAVKP